MGYERQLFPRPELHHMLLSKIPVEKIHFSSKISFFEQNQDGVTMTFENNTTARGDILVGADGARSSVRQHLYKTLDKEGLLPKADNMDVKKGYISLLGTTNAIDPAKYPDVSKEDCQSYGIVGDGGNPYTVSWTAVSFKCQKRVHMKRSFAHSPHFSILHVSLVGHLYRARQQDLLECCRSVGS